ncbi:hypothetical protein DFH11DRAFT_1613123 [Phellopilus nigrolimitatus]|nr:hypothetical protein DFH11DRAFT_1613123 [Phellopilus nigrolimitatus]
MRVLALYSRRRSFVITLGSVFAMESAFMLGMMIYITTYEQIAVGGTDGFAFCGMDRNAPPILITMVWSAPLLFEIILMVLAIQKSAEIWSTTGLGGVSLAKVLIQDQVAYFVMVLVFTVMKIVGIWTTAAPVRHNILTLFGSPALPCVLGGQLMIRLKEAADRDVVGGTSFKMGSVSVIEFN